MTVHDVGIPGIPNSLMLHLEQKYCMYYLFLDVIKCCKIHEKTRKILSFNNI